MAIAKDNIRKKCDNCGKIYATEHGILNHVKDCIPEPVHYGSPGTMGLEELDDGELVHLYGWR